ncbi:hypothetical protein [Verrucomicrobium sp. BvORR034]|uniref:hypothetical protein n=1 Tax=Verrucomicrobium sp. BvORR034 TaxID=1396418 RepID=UPI0006796555|nr:hypothetical protein [Verrucomicrobium sp. BvORR034]
MKRTVTCSLLACLILPFSQVCGQSDPAVEVGRPGKLAFKEETVGVVRGPGFKAEGVFMGTPLVLDEAYAAKHDLPALQAPFKVVVPKDNNLYFLPGGNKTGVPELARLSIATEDKKAVEILRFVTMTIPLQRTSEDRLVVCANLLATKAFPQITSNYEQARQLDLYVTRIRGNDAVCLVAEMVKPGSSESYWVKAVGMMPANSENGVMAFFMADKQLSEIKTQADLLTKGFSQKVIHSLEFLPVTTVADAPSSEGYRSASEALRSWAGAAAQAGTTPKGVAASPGNANSLKALFEKYHAALMTQDAATAALIVRDLLPDETRLQSAIGGGATPEIWAKIKAFHDQLPKAGDAALAKLLAAKPAQTMVEVHGATTEEIAQYAEGSVAFAEFPSAARDLAKAGILKPGVTFFEVEFLEPGAESGMKYHLFYWDGASWSMLGPVWRGLK